MKIKLSFLYILISIIIFMPAFSDENNKGLNFYTGMFDFSDDGKRSTIYGVEHQNENLYRNTIFGKISPVTGAMITADNAVYVYSGIQAESSCPIGH